MRQYQKIIVNVSLTETDIPALKLAGLIARLAQSQSVTFVHLREGIDIPESMKQAYPALAEPAASAARPKAEALISQYFHGPDGCHTELVIQDASPSLALLALSLRLDADLIVVGDLDIDRSVALKVARKAPCSVLLVPGQCSGDFSKIGMALDLSKYSGYIYDTAINIAAARGIGAIQGLNFYSIPNGFQKNGLPLVPIRAELRAFSEQRLHSFLRSRESREVQVRATVEHSPTPGIALLSIAERHHLDLLVLGCRGKDAMTATLLGTNAETVLRGSMKAAILAVKEKGTGKRFLQSLLEPDTDETEPALHASSPSMVAG